MNKHPCLLIGMLLAIGSSRQASATSIYDNTGPWLGTTAFTQEQQGDEVYAAGTYRQVTELDIGVYRQHIPGTADLQARLYADNGPGGTPGTLLWQSAVMDATLSGGVQLIGFQVPDVIVPEEFTWTLQVTDSSIAVGLANAGPPTVGNDPSYGWFGYAGEWTKLPGVQWMASVEAVPDEFLTFVPTLVAASGILLAGYGVKNPQAGG